MTVSSNLVLFEKQEATSSVQSQTLSNANWRSVAVIRMKEPHKVLRRLAKHFAHKLPVSARSHACAIDFEIGLADVRCTQIALYCYCRASTQQDLKEVESTMERHIVAMSRLKGLALEWCSQK